MNVETEWCTEQALLKDNAQADTGTTTKTIEQGECSKAWGSEQ
jgi:hypothetical protein